MTQQEINRQQARDTINRQQAKDMLLVIKNAIHTLEELGPDYAIWQNAKISYKTIFKIKKLLELIG
jgi:hypothetical protein